jgi:hypothetical protein
MYRLNVLRCSLAVVGLAIGAAAFGAQPQVTPAKPGVAAAADLVCKNRLRPGSHIKMRRCLTAAQWAAAYPWGITAAEYPWGITPEVRGGGGTWGAVSTAGQSVGMSAFTPQR